jgi:hypothetical protein
MIDRDRNIDVYGASIVKQIAFSVSSPTIQDNLKYKPYQERDGSVPFYIYEDKYHKEREFYGIIIGVLSAITFSLAFWALVLWAWFKFS